MRDEHVQFHERTRIKEFGDPLPRRLLAQLVLGRDAIRTAPLAGFLFHRSNALNPLVFAGHMCDTSLLGNSNKGAQAIPRDSQLLSTYAPCILLHVLE